MVNAKKRKGYTREGTTLHKSYVRVPQHERMKSRVRGEVRRCEGTKAHHSSSQQFSSRTYTNCGEGNALHTFYVMVAQHLRRKLECYVEEGERCEGTTGECRRVYVLWRSNGETAPVPFFVLRSYSFTLPRLRETARLYTLATLGHESSDAGVKSTKKMANHS